MIYSLEKILVIFFLALSWFLLCSKIKSVGDKIASVASYTTAIDSKSNDQVFSKRLAEEINEVPEEIKIISYWLGTR